MVDHKRTVREIQGLKQGNGHNFKGVSGGQDKGGPTLTRTDVEKQKGHFWFPTRNRMVGD